MKKYLFLLVLIGFFIAFYKINSSQENLTTEKKSPLLVQHNTSNKLILKQESQQPEDIKSIENEMLSYSDKSFDEFSPEEIKRFNFLDLQRATILKNQIFAKAKSKGYL